jgi:putative ABC transport system ATP-binding protein
VKISWEETLPPLQGQKAQTRRDSIVKISGLEKRYRGEEGIVPILTALDLEIPRGSMTVIRGASGSGKTTLLNILGGLDRWDSGRVEVDGISLQGLSARELTRYRAERIGFIFQFHNLIHSLTVLENVLLGLEAVRPVNAQDEALARRYLQDVGLASLENQFPARLSGGQHQRVAIVRALAKGPSLILADEPTGSLDEHSGETVIAVLKELQVRTHATVVVVTHNPEWEQHADAVFEMRSGRLACKKYDEPPAL